MAKIKIKGADSGSAVYTLTTGTGSTDRTITLPDGSGTLAFTTGDDDKLPLAGGTMTGNISHASNLTLDVGGKLILDADDAGTVWIQDAGTIYGVLEKSSSDFVLRSGESDGDIVFKGNDGGSTITALTLDMSNAGAATFNSYADFQGNNIYFADNAKANFGTGEDLQIYHDGSNSVIHDVGTGNLLLKGDNLSLRSASNESYLTGVSNGEVSVYHNNSVKLATTSTGVDVTGVAVTDGITSSGNITFDNGNSSVSIKSDGTNGSYIQFGSNEYLRFLYDNGASESIRLIDGGGITFNGDSAADNALNDYEEGVHQLSITGSTGGSMTMKSGYEYLAYTKIGRLVTVQGRWETTAKNSATGNMTFSLPFTAGSFNGQSAVSSGVFSLYRANANFNNVRINVFSSANTATIWYNQGGTGDSDDRVEMQNIDGTVEGYMCLTYMTA